MRLVKFLAVAGVASRRESEKLIAAGRITVKGKTVLNPAIDVEDSDEVAFDGERVKIGQRKRVVYALNKPMGVVSTASDTHGRRTVVELILDSQRLYPVGRLDIDTTGLILITNDGDLAYRLTHPSFEVPKTYRAKIGNPPVSQKAILKLRKGLRLEDGRTAPARVTLLAPNLVEITIHEGRKRQVRRMLTAVGHDVNSLERIKFGNLGLGRLARGKYRRLTEEEIEKLAPKR